MLQEITGKVRKARTELLKLTDGRPYIVGRQTYAIYEVDTGVCLGFLAIGPGNKDQLIAWFRGWSEGAQFRVAFLKDTAVEHGWCEISRLVYSRTGFLLVDKWPDPRVSLQMKGDKL